MIRFLYLLTVSMIREALIYSWRRPRPRENAPSGIANPRDTTGYRCGLRLAGHIFRDRFRLARINQCFLSRQETQSSAAISRHARSLARNSHRIQAERYAYHMLTFQQGLVLHLDTGGEQTVHYVYERDSFVPLMQVTRKQALRLASTTDVKALMAVA